MKVLILGASGATGSLVVRQLIKRQISVRVVVRQTALVSPEMQGNPLVEIKKGNIAEFNHSQMACLLQDCNAVVSCLGHNITIKGMFGKPQNLVCDTMKKNCETVNERADKLVRIILMSTTAYTNTMAGEKNTSGERIVLSILKLLLPPHRDNVLAADYLQGKVGKENKKIDWIAVRPDSLLNSETESVYEVCDSMVRSPIFNAGKVSRINVSRFMADLLTNDELWREWRFRMPVLYNK